jgi:transposase-like protein
LFFSPKRRALPRWKSKKKGLGQMIWLSSPGTRVWPNSAICYTRPVHRFRLVIASKSMISTASLTTDMMVRALTKLLSEGVTIEVVAAGVVIEPGSAPAALLLAGLERHYRHLHALKANPEKKRQPVIKPEQMPAIRKRLSAPGATAASVAQELGIGRSTLFRYLERFGDDGGLNRPHQAKKGVPRTLAINAISRRVMRTQRP